MRSRRYCFFLILAFCSLAVVISCASAPQVAPSQVQVPDDVQAFFDKYEKDFLTFKLDVIMPHYSDKFLQNGYDKYRVSYEFNKNLNLLSGLFSKCTVTLTKFKIDKNNPNIAYIDGKLDFGFMYMYYHHNNTVVYKENGQTKYWQGVMIIKENGQWKWYGNQQAFSPSSMAPLIDYKREN